MGDNNPGINQGTIYQIIDKLSYKLQPIFSCDVLKRVNGSADFV